MPRPRPAPMQRGLPPKPVTARLLLVCLWHRLLHDYGAGVLAPVLGKSENGVIGMRVGSGCHGRIPAELASDSPSTSKISSGTSTTTAIMRFRRRRRSASIIRLFLL